MHHVALMRRLREVVPPTEYELEMLHDSGRVRCENNVGWWSGELVTSGWLIKGNGVRRITDDGREARIRYPDAYEFGEVAHQNYKDWKAKRAASKSATEDWTLAERVLALVPQGRWISAGDLGKVAGYEPTSTGIHVWRAKPARWHVVLRQTGELPADAYGVEDRSVEQRQLLAAEGIEASPPAPAELKLSLEDFQALAADLVGTRRAWHIRVPRCVAARSCRNG